MRAEMGKDPSRAPPSQLNLPPGFRFYPTDEELVVHYLCKKAASEPFSVPIIAEVELYKFDPWDLPERALFGEKEWFFFSPRDRKYPNGSRPNRAAGAGYWKATGTDKPINTMGKKVGVKKALVFYTGKAPKGVKTNWIMHEYRLADSSARPAKAKGSLRLDDWVLCRIYKKCSSSSVQRVASMKEQSESSCLEDVPSPPPQEFGTRLDFLQEGSQMDTKGMASLQSFYNETPDQVAARNASELNMYMQQLKRSRPVLDMSAENGQRKYGCIKSYNDQGACSWDVSHRESNAYSSRQPSSAEASVQEDDAVESTFDSMASFPSSQFPQSFYGLDSGLLPSPKTAMLGGGAGSFASLLESDLGTLFSPHSEYASGSLHVRGFPHDRNSFLNWDSKVNFST